MESGRGKFAVWVGLCSAVPLVALAAVLLFGAPTLPTTLVAFLVLGLIAPRLFTVTPDAGREDAAHSKPGPGNPARLP